MTLITDLRWLYMCDGEIRVKKCREYTVESDSLEPRVDADGASSHMFNLSWDVFTEAGLILSQHFKHRSQIKPPLDLGHPVPENQWHTVIRIINN